MTIKGKVHKIMDVKQITDSFKVCEFAIVTDGEYPQTIGMQAVNDKIAIVDGLLPGDMVTVHYDLRGREVNDRFFVTVNAWKLDKA